MQSSLIYTDNLAAYSVKEVAPIAVALAFVVALGGVVAASIIICGWKGAKSIGVNWKASKVEILCR